MTALANGTYFISSSVGGGDRFYLGFGSGTAGERLVINSVTGSDSHQWDVESSSIENTYTLRNRRYGTYATVDPPPGSLSRVIAGPDPRSWYATLADSGYTIGVDQSGTLVWTLSQYNEEDNTPIVLYVLERFPSNFWEFKPVQATPTSTSTSGLPSASPPCPTCSCPAKEGMDLGDKIGLGVGLGVGIPTLLVAIVALFKDSPLAKIVKGYIGKPTSHGEEGIRLMTK
ncbi:hypothetical protein H1R20_g2640, partial [Candolleomyces eurysporus]